MSKSYKKSKKKQNQTSAASKQTGKQKKLFSNLLKIVKQFVLGKNFFPLTEKELMERLALPQEHLPILQQILEELAEQKLVEKNQERILSAQPSQQLFSGTVRMHARGFGFVQLESGSPYSEDIFVPKQLTKNAVDGDLVEVVVNPVVSEKGPEGKIISILQRARTHLGAIIRAREPGDEFIAYAPMLGMQQRVLVQLSKSQSLKIGDRVVLEVIDWGSKESDVIAKLASYLGHISDASCDTLAAIEEFELKKTFSSKAIEEAKSFGKRVLPKEIQKREDLRHLTTFTIDPDTAKDFDDALTISVDKKGHYHLIVHIADVSHYVRPDSALDQEAQSRSNSTYFPNYCLPMLPGELSENLCSLKANVNRLTVSVFMEFDPNGTLVDYRIARTVIKSAKRFTYKEAKEVLDQKRKSSHLETLQLMTKLCKLLKIKRHERGSIEFSLPELVILVDKEGMPYGTDYVLYDITHQMVEEFMLKANETIALHLHKQGKNLTYRIHDTPAEENLRDFSLLANAFGFKLPDLPTAYDMQELFQQAADTPYGNYLASNYIRRMRLAAYSAENIGHYGLSLEHYCHFTSPIRRYVDLVVHRILFGEDDDFEYLQAVCQHASEQERISAKAEMSVLALKKLRLLHSRYKQDPYQHYQAIITKVKNFGLYFEVVDYLLEGFIHIADIGQDYYIYEEERMRLKGSREGEVFAPGDQITVILQNIDFITQETKWYIVDTQPKKSSRSNDKVATKQKKLKQLPDLAKKEKRSPKKEQKKLRLEKKEEAKNVASFLPKKSSTKNLPMPPVKAVGVKSKMANERKGSERKPVPPSHLQKFIPKKVPHHSSGPQKPAPSKTGRSKKN